VSNSVLEEYVATLVDPRGEPVVRELDRVIMATQPDLDLALKYKILMYALNGDFHTWVCSINAGRRKVALHFLYGVLLDDPKKVLRAGSSVLMTWDIGFDENVDTAAVAAYVAEAVRRNPDYLADREGILDRSRQAAAKAGRRPTARGS
jgi:hypothetical protein